MVPSGSFCGDDVSSWDACTRSRRVYMYQYLYCTCLCIYSRSFAFVTSDVNFRDDVSIDSIPSTPLLDNSANKRKAILGTSGALATKRPPTRRHSQSEVSMISVLCFETEYMYMHVLTHVYKYAYALKCKIFVVAFVGVTIIQKPCLFSCYSRVNRKSTTIRSLQTTGEFQA